MDLLPAVGLEAPVARKASKEESGRGATESVEDLRLMLLELRAEIRDRLPENRIASPARCLKDIAPDWLALKLPNIAAPDTFEGRVRLHLMPRLGHHTYLTLMPMHVQALMNSMLKEGFAKQTVNHVRDAGRQLVDWATKNKQWAGENPFAQADKLAVRWVKETLTKDEAAKLLRYGLDVQWRCLFALALFLGPRRKTIFHLRIDDVNMERRIIDFRVTKSGAPILGVPIPDGLVPYLKQALAVARPPWLFSQKNGRQMSSKSHVLNNALDDAIDRVGIKRQGRAIHLTFHGLRRCSSTLHQQAGCHPWVVSKVLGHSQESLALLGNMVENMTAKSYSDFEEHFVRSELNKLKFE